MELEAVGRISMGDLRFKVRRQVDDVDGAEWALFWAYAASDTEGFRDESDFGVWGDFDAELAGPHDGTRFLAFLTAFLEAYVSDAANLGYELVPNTLGLH